MFRIHPTFFDLIAILLSVFMLISVLMAQNIQQEYLTKVDMLKKAVENKNTDGPDTDPLSLTVILKVEGSYLLIAALLGVVIWAWFTGIDDFDKRYDIEKAAAQVQKASESKRDVPIIVEEVTPPVKIKKALVKKKKTIKKRKAAKNKKHGKGESEPNLFARYEMPVSEYLDHMTSRGARVLVYDKLTGRFVCEVLNNGLLMKSYGTEATSNHLRRITDDFPQGKVILAKVEKHFGRGSHEILLVVPDYLYESFAANILRIVSGKGLKMKDIVTVFMTYKGNSSTLLVYVEKVSGSFGTRQIGEYFRL